VILSKVLLTKVDKVSQDIKLIAANKRASKSFEISDQDEFNIFLKNVELLRTGTEGSINEPLKNTPKNSQDMVQSKITTQLNLEQLI
jgi:tmRNA-binding protein